MGGRCARRLSIVLSGMDIVPLDPLAPTPRGMWSGHGVRVRRRRGPHRAHSGLCTPRFCTHRRGALLTVEHDLTPDELSDELTLLLVDELVDSGALQGQPEFELVFTGIVRSTVFGGLPSWLRFYRNSLARLEDGSATFAPVHEHAADLLLGHSLVDLGSCFGFFPLRAAQAGYSVTATDLSAPTMDLLAQASTRLCRPLRTMTCNAATVPLPDRYTDTVTALHLVEHLTPTDTLTVIEEALRLARRRVVIAVPYEDEPQECYGHIQRFDSAELRRLAVRVCARHSDVTADVHDHHGGWLILDRASSINPR